MRHGQYHPSGEMRWDTLRARWVSLNEWRRYYGPKDQTGWWVFWIIGLLVTLLLGALTIIEPGTTSDVPTPPREGVVTA